MNLSKEHVEFVLRTWKKITYTAYVHHRKKLTEKEIEKTYINFWRHNRYEWKITISSLYREAKKKWFKKSFSYFYSKKDLYVKNNKLWKIF